MTSMHHSEKSKDGFRNYESKDIRETVRNNYYLNHTKQTVDFVLGKRDQYAKLNHCEMSIWDALNKLDQIVDDSDPDTSATQIMHAIQTAERIREDGHPPWMILAGLIHDLGKVLVLFGEPQWAVVGDTFPVGCRYSDKIVYPEFFKDNPDIENSLYQTKLGIYSEHCGLDNILLSWGHDEYLYLVVKDYLPEEALYIIRYHSFYPCHRDGEYEYFMNDHDRAMMRWVKRFNLYDLYSKADKLPDVERLKPYYHELINEFLPEKLRW